MLTLFQNITSELTDLEKEKFVPLLIDTLNFHTGEKRVTGKVLSSWFKSMGYRVSDVRIRKMINYIRVLNLTPGQVIIGAGNGYYMTSEPDVIEDQIESIQGRVDSSLAVIDSLKAQLISIKHKRSA